MTTASSGSLHLISLLEFCKSFGSELVFPGGSSQIKWFRQQVFHIEASRLLVHARRAVLKEIGARLAERRCTSIAGAWSGLGRLYTGLGDLEGTYTVRRRLAPSDVHW